MRRGDFLYGIDGRCGPVRFSPAPSLRCVEWKTGKIRWEEGSVGAASLILAGDRLLAMTEKGELVCASATGDGFKALGARANHAATTFARISGAY